MTSKENSGDAELDAVIELVESKRYQDRLKTTAHDYPQRVRYRRRGELIYAETSLFDASKGVRY